MDPSAATPGSASIISSPVPFLTLRSSETVLARGAAISHLDIHGDARVIVEAGAIVAHATTYDRARIEVRGGQISILTLYGESSALLDDAIIKGGSHSGTAMGNVQVVLAKRSVLEVRATEVDFHSRSLNGTWRTGGRFSIAIGHNFGTDEQPDYREVVTMPPQVRVIDIPDPSFSCERARSVVEKTICANADLARLDRRLANRFADAMEQSQNFAALRKAQRDWLKKRDSCAQLECIVAAYTARLGVLEGYTGRFDSGYAGRLCQQFLNVEQRSAILGDAEGANDINNDGISERVEACWGGSMNAPCTEYKDSAGHALPIEQQGFEWKDYWTYGEQLFRYDGRTFIYHAFDDGLAEPAYLSYVTPLNREFVVCDYENVIESALIEGGAKVCHAIVAGDPTIETVELPRATDRIYQVFGRSETALVAQGSADVDNDGTADEVMELAYESGAGRGCDFNYFELASDDMSVRRDAANRLLNELQGISADGYRARSCGGVRNRLFRFEGKIYYETNTTNNDTTPHAVRLTDRGTVSQVCTFGRKIRSTVKSIR